METPVRIITGNSPYVWKTGQVLDPNRANDNWAFLSDACADVFDRRYAYSVVQYPFHKDPDGYSGISATSSQETRRFRISPAESLSIVGMFVDGSLTSTNASATISFVDTSLDAAPAGVPTPIFTCDCDTAEKTQHFAQEIPLTAGSTYAFQLDGYGFTTDNLVLTVHFRSDRFNTAGTDTRQVPSITYYTEADQASAANWNANDNAISTAVTANIAKTSAQKPSLFVMHDFVDGYDSDLRRWDIPRVDSALFRSSVVRIQAFAHYASAGSAGNTVTWTLQDASGASTGLVATCDMNGQTFATASDTSPTVNLATAITGVSSDSSRDYRLVVANNSAINCIKSYCYIWVS